MCRILHISKFLVPAKNSQCVEFYTLDGAGIKSSIMFIIISPTTPDRTSSIFNTEVRLARTVERLAHASAPT